VVCVDGRESHILGFARIGDMETEIPKRGGIGKKDDKACRDIL
jgi:hypothetical protein